MAMVNTMINPLQVKDSRWLTLEVCREFQRNRCTRPETECKFAHPPAHVEVQNGRVTCCFDSIKGKCQRKDPPCKYLHPPQHLKEQLLQNGRNNLIIRNMQMQALAASQLQPMVPGMMPTLTGSKPVPYPQAGVVPGQYPVVHENQVPRSTYPSWSAAGNYARYQAHPYLLSQNPSGGAAFNPYLSPSVAPGIVHTIDTTANAAVSGATQTVQGIVPGTGVPTQQKVARPDRLEPVSTATSVSDPASWQGSCVDSLAPSSHYSHVYFQPQVVEVLTTQGKKRPRDPGDDFILGVSAVPGMMPIAKRPAVADSKSGMIPMYPAASGTSAAYQQAALAMQLQQPPFVPVTMPLIPSAQQSSVAVPSAAAALVTNAASVNYFDEANQLRATLPVCRDFKCGQCKRPQCKYVHLVEEYVEVSDGKVTVCRDAAKGKCTRPMCKYYHIPLLPPILG